MSRDYLDLFQDDAGVLGFGASPPSAADVARTRANPKPLAYETKIPKGGKKAKKRRPQVWGSEGRLVRDPTGGRPDGGDRLPPPAG